MPDDAWLTKVVVETPADALDFDLAIDASGAGNPSPVDAGYAPFSDNPVPSSPIAAYLLLMAVAIVAVPVAVARALANRPLVVLADDDVAGGAGLIADRRRHPFQRGPAGSFE